jgi:hypothetical protein
MMTQEADNSLQLDNLCSSGISQHDNFSANDQDTAGLESVGMAVMAPTNTTGSQMCFSDQESPQVQKVKI